MSQTACFHPIASALTATERFLGPDRQWTASDRLGAKEFFQCFDPRRRELSRIPEIESLAQLGGVDEVNAFLTCKGFQIQLEPIQPKEIATASALDVLVKWRVVAERMDVYGGQTRYDGIRLKMDDGVVFYQARGHRHAIARIRTQSGDDVYVTQLDEALAGAQLLDKASVIVNHYESGCEEYGAIVFPMVTLDQRVNIDWLIGASTISNDDQPAFISQALQQTRLRINEVGARAQSGVGLTVAKSCLPQDDLIIDKPFLFAIQRPDFSEPFIAARITSEDWKNPGSLA